MRLHGPSAISFGIACRFHQNVEHELRVDVPLDWSRILQDLRIIVHRHSRRFLGKALPQKCPQKFHIRDQLV